MISTLEKSFAVYASTPSEKAQWVGHIEKCVEELIQNGLPNAMRSDKASRLCNPCHDDKNGEGGPDLQPKSKNFTVFLCSNVADSIKSLNILR